MNRRKGRPPVGDSNTRLAYSTGGDTPEPEARPSTAARPGPGIRLHLERRASGRVVTVVSGLPGSQTEVATLARTLKTACGAGGTVKDGALELQGDHRARIESALTKKGLKSKRSGG